MVTFWLSTLFQFLNENFFFVLDFLNYHFLTFFFVSFLICHFFPTLSNFWLSSLFQFLYFPNLLTFFFVLVFLIYHFLPFFFVSFLICSLFLLCSPFYSVLVFLICPLFDCLLCLFPNLHSFSYFVHFLTFYSVPVLERQGADVGHGWQSHRNQSRSWELKKLSKI